MQDAARKIELDRMTVIIYDLAVEFGVPWMAAAYRAIGLDLMTWNDLGDIRELAREERAWRILRE